MRVRATCHACYAFDVGHQIDLEACKGRLSSTERLTIRGGRRVPPHFEYAPAPLRVAEEPSGLSIAGLTAIRVELVLFDFGAASVNYAFGYDGPLEGLVPISVALHEAQPLADEGRARLERLVVAAGTAVTRPQLAPIVEDYFIFQIDALEGRDGSTALPAGIEPLLAQILRATPSPLAPEEVTDAMTARLAYGTTDATLIDWNAALIADPEPDATRAVLELANVQLLELRHLDSALDRSVERAYSMLARWERGFFRRLRPPAAELRELGELQMDGAILFERVSNALKLIGDQFLSRVYRAVSGRFHFEEWDRAIERKLDVLDRTYQKVGDQVSNRRLEVLEWIVILLIALEIFLR